jgi:uncharacterized cupin superfamily protein
MPDIRVEKSVPEARVAELGCRKWPIWTKEESEFEWSYDEPEACLFLEGEVVVTPGGGGAPVRFGKGDFVQFPKGLSCTWKVLKAVRKHYRFG